jgi:hypothetical protein
MSATRIGLTLALGLLAGVACAQTPGAQAAQAMRARDFLGSLGVNTHLNYTDGTYANYEAVIADLDYLGIHNLRDNTPNPYGGIPYRNDITALQAATAAGNHFDFITWPGLPLDTTLDQITAVERMHAGSVIAVEGTNETNNNPVTYRGEHGTRAALAYQRDLYRAVHRLSLLRHVAVYYYTGFDVGTTLTGLADFANCHPYSYQGEQPAARIASSFGQQFTMAPPYPKVITEAGYFDVPFMANGVDDATQAKDTLNLYLDAFAQGVSLTYVYQVLSAYPDQGSDTQSGMFRRDHSPKPVATAIHNLTTILADGGHGRVPPALLDYSVAAMPVTGHSILLEKSSGIFDIVLWAEPANWNDHLHQPIDRQPIPVTVTLNGTAGTIAVYDPMVGSEPIERERNVNALVLGLADHPVIIEVRPTRQPLLTADSQGAATGNLN